jgi:hypothetical protein
MHPTGRWIGCLAAVSALAWPGGATAELRIPPTDEEIVRRADLIAVGRLRDGALRCLPRVDRHGARSWDYTATLEVGEVLRGAAPADGAIGIRFLYGTLPPRESWTREGGYDAIDVGQVMGSLVADTLGWLPGADPGEPPRDVLWLLEGAAGGAGGEYLVPDPEAVQVLERREYLMAYLEEDPEAAVRRHPDPAPARGDERFLGQRQIERALAVPVAGARAEALADLYARRAGWHSGQEAREGLVELGAAAGPALRRLYEDPELDERRAEIVELWGRIGYREAVPALILLLEEETDFWSRQELAPGWWNADLDPAASRERRGRYGETLNAVVALGRLGDPQAVPALEAARRLWAFVPEPTQILEQCEYALAALARAAPPGTRRGGR